jgi:hypothetical protein
MPQAWSDVVSHYQRELAADPNGEGFRLAFASVGTLAARIDETGLGQRLFGWTSMHDLCIQQLDRPPYSCAYLRVAPLRSGQVDFRYIDTAVEALQWHRIVVPEDTVRRFTSFLNQLKWVDRESADCILE